MKKIFAIFVLSSLIHSLFSQNTYLEEIVDTNQKVLSMEVYFDFGKYDIKMDADSILQKVVTFCENKNNLMVQLTAHTDGVGSDENNLKLSENRMLAVQQFLELKGLYVDTISTNIFGESQPIATNDSEIGRQQNRRATIDVFQKIKLLKINGDIRDKETGKGIAADVIIRTKYTRDSIRTDTSGYFESLVPVGAVVGIDAYSKGYFLESTMLKALPGKVSELKYELVPLLVGEKVDIKNLYFVGNQAVLLKKSEPELPKILRFMQVNTCTKIEIAGHVNLPNRPKTGTSSFEYKLSVNRAKLVYDYLIQQGIPEKRLAYKGYGNWEMHYPKARIELFMAKNRRVEIRVLETKIED